MRSLKLTANAPEHRPGPKRKRSYSSHPFSGATVDGWNPWDGWNPTNNGINYLPTGKRRISAINRMLVSGRVKYQFVWPGCDGFSTTISGKTGAFKAIYAISQHPVGTHIPWGSENMWKVTLWIFMDPLLGNARKGYKSGGAQSILLKRYKRIHTVNMGFLRKDKKSRQPFRIGIYSQ